MIRLEPKSNRSKPQLSRHTSNGLIIRYSLNDLPNRILNFCHTLKVKPNARVLQIIISKN